MRRDEGLALAGFANGSLYDAARPDYPEEAVEYFVARFDLNRTTRVLDLGAGTGIFSRQVVPYVGRLTAVDPSASMREAFVAGTPGVEVLAGSDVDIPLDDASVDVVFVAQAFHWFDAPRALVEIRRVLRSGGGLGLIWNERDETVDWVAELGRAMRWDRCQPYATGTDFSAVLAGGPFDGVERVRLAHSQTLSHEGLYRRVLTTSYISIMDDEQRAQVMRDVVVVVEPLPDPLVLPYVTDVYSARAD